MRAIQLVPNFSCPWLNNLAKKKCGKLNFVIQALGYFGPVIKTSIKTGHWHLKTVSAVAKKAGRLKYTVSVLVLVMITFGVVFSC